MSKYSIEDIGRYAEGDMTGEELIQFEQALKEDVEMQSNLVFYQNVHSSLKMKIATDEADENFKSSLNQIGENYFKGEAKVVPMRRYIAWTSAIAAVFVLFLVWAPWNKDLYRQYADTEMLAMTERGDNDEKLMEQASDAFNKKEFSDARVELEKITKADPDNAMAQYYYAITLIETGELQKSRLVLDKLYKGMSIFKYDAAFYVALSFLKEKDEVNAKEWLKRIPPDASVYEKSRELLNKLK